MERLLVFTLAGLVAQLVDGSLGMGYGMTSTSLLVTSGTAAALASASVHLAEVGTTLVSGIAHHRFGNVDWRGVRALALPGAAGAFVGAAALSSVSTDVATPWVAAVLTGLGLYVLVRSRRPVPMVVDGRPHRRRFLGGLGLTAGFLDATGGGGWGPIGTSTLLASGRLEPRKVIGTIAASEFLVAVGASVGFFLTLPWRALDPVLVLALLAGGAAAAPVAAWFTQHVEARTLGTVIGVFIVATNARTLAGLAGLDPGFLGVLTTVLAIGWLVMAARLAVGIRRRLAAVPAEPAPALTR